MAKKKVEQTEGTKVKKPFYKRWWFITIVALVIIGAIFGPDEEEKQAKENKTEQSEQKQKEDTDKEKENEETKEEEFAITEDMSEEQKIENIVKKVCGGQYDSHELVKNDDGQLGDINVTTYFSPDKYWDGKRAAEAQDAKIVDILKLLKENNISYSYLVYEATTDFTDQYLSLIHI